jgi:hypothetical protein
MGDKADTFQWHPLATKQLYMLAMIQRIHAEDQLRLCPSPEI